MTNFGLFKDGGSIRILSLQPLDKVNMLCDKTKNCKFLLRSLHEKRLVPRGGKPVILWPLFVPCEQRFISGMAFSTCVVVYSVAVIRLVGFFYKLQLHLPSRAQLYEGPLYNGPRFFGFSLKAFYRWIFSIRFQVEHPIIKLQAKRIQLNSLFKLLYLNSNFALAGLS